MRYLPSAVPYSHYTIGTTVRETERSLADVMRNLLFS